MTTPIVILRFDPTGMGHCLYTEAVDLASIGQLHIRRATHVEFSNTSQQWQARDIDGSLLHTSPSRAACLQWERENLTG